MTEKRNYVDLSDDCQLASDRNELSRLKRKKIGKPQPKYNSKATGKRRQWTAQQKIDAVCRANGLRGQAEESKTVVCE